MADEQKYYVLRSDKCMFESMTREQILTAIEQAVEFGVVHDVNSGFITRIQEQNGNSPLKFWVGTQAEYNKISEPVKGCFYIISDDTDYEDIMNAINDLREEVKSLKTQINNMAGGI